MDFEETFLLKDSDACETCNISFWSEANFDSLYMPKWSIVVKTIGKTFIFFFA